MKTDRTLKHLLSVKVNRMQWIPKLCQMLQLVHNVSPSYLISKIHVFIILLLIAHIAAHALPLFAQFPTTDRILLCLNFHCVRNAKRNMKILLIAVFMPNLMPAQAVAHTFGYKMQSNG